MNKPTGWRFLLVVALCLSPVGLAQAETSIEVGLTGLIGQHDYPGTNDTSGGFSPLLLLDWNMAAPDPDSNSLVVGPINLHLSTLDGFHMEALRLHLKNGPDLLFGAGVRGQHGRDKKDDSGLTGLGDIKPYATLNLYLSNQPRQTNLAYDKRFLFVLERESDLSGNHNGVTSRLLLAYSYLWPRNQSRSLLGVSTTWADQHYMQRYFGVTAAQASASGRSQFAAKDGIRDVALHLKSRCQLSNRWALYETFDYQRLLGDAADSPIVDPAGSPNQFQFSLGLSYQIK